MDKPWFNLNPNNFTDKWWLYSNILDTNQASITKSNMDVICYFIIQDNNMAGIFYRVSIWYKDDPNRYQCIKYENESNFDKKLKDMREGDIVYMFDCKFKVYNCRFSEPSQLDLCKILERI